MGKMVYLMGKSSTGKDTVYRRLLERDGLSLKKLFLIPPDRSATARSRGKPITLQIMMDTMF